MKYMGSKRWMLGNGLGTVLTEEARKSRRFFDLFSGSGAVASFVAEGENIPCYAYDLQEFSSILSGSVLRRTTALDSNGIWNKWLRRAAELMPDALREAPSEPDRITKKYVLACRRFCARSDLPFIVRAYGGHYFSPAQAFWLHGLRTALPVDPMERCVALASLVQAASRCAASPGHTAQPFQPTKTAKPFIAQAWSKPLSSTTKLYLDSLCPRFARRKGDSFIGDANDAAMQLRENDLVFLDPPYSGVHYSRFYHVLETVAKGCCSSVVGIGRYPDASERPNSRYSKKTTSAEALEDLLSGIATKGARAVLTFPSHSCSNGLSGESVMQVAETHFKIEKKLIKSTFSTLGGTDRIAKNGNCRLPRQKATEMILVLKPR